MLVAGRVPCPPDVGEGFDAWYVGRGVDPFDTRGLQRSRRIYVCDTGVGMGTAQYSGVQHAGHLHIACEPGAACDLAHGLQPPGIAADCSRGWAVLCRSFSPHRGGRSHHGVNDPDVPCASAEIAGQRVGHLIAGRGWIAIQEGLGGHDHARGAIAALDGTAIYEGLLQGVQVVRAADSLDRRHMLASNPAHRRAAGADGASVKDNCTRTALALVVAPLLGAGQIQVLAQDIK